MNQMVLQHPEGIYFAKNTDWLYITSLITLLATCQINKSMDMKYWFELIFFFFLLHENKVSREQYKRHETGAVCVRQSVQHLLWLFIWKLDETDKMQENFHLHGKSNLFLIASEKQTNLKIIVTFTKSKWLESCLAGPGIILHNLWKALKS